MTPTTGTMYSIGILDNDPCAIDSIQRMIEAYLKLSLHNDQPSIDVWSTTFVTDAIDRARSGNGILFLDMQLDGTTGLHVAKKVHALNPDITLVGITSYDPQIFQQLARQCGLSDLLDKSSLKSALPSVLAKCLQNHDRKATSHSTIPELSANERTLLALSMRDLNSKQIATAMGISIGTVFSHRHRIKDKFKLDNWSEIIEQCKIWNILQER